MASISIIDAHWHHHFGNLQLSSNVFYSAVEESIKNQQLPQVKMSRINLSEGGIFSSKREYLRIVRNQYVFDVCAAPFGKEFFISWWLGETTGFFTEFLARIPFIGRFAAKESKRKTYFQIDTETMFKESIHSIIQEIIDSVVKEKGLRSLTELERQIAKETPKL